MYIFYINHRENKIVLTNHDKRTFHEKYGTVFEILNSFKDTNNFQIMLDKVQKMHYNYSIETWLIDEVKTKKSKKKNN